MDRYIDDNKIILICLLMMFVSILLYYGQSDKGITILGNIASGMIGALSMRTKDGNPK